MSNYLVVKLSVTFFPLSAITLCNFIPIFLICSLLALSPEDVLPAMYLCTNKIAPDHENIVSLIPCLAICL